MLSVLPLSARSTSENKGNKFTAIKRIILYLVKKNDYTRHVLTNKRKPGWLHYLILLIQT